MFLLLHFRTFSFAVLLQKYLSQLVPVHICSEKYFTSCTSHKATFATVLTLPHTAASSPPENAEITCILYPVALLNICITLLSETPVMINHVPERGPG